MPSTSQEERYKKVTDMGRKLAATPNLSFRGMESDAAALKTTLLRLQSDDENYHPQACKLLNDALAIASNLHNAHYKLAGLSHQNLRAEEALKHGKTAAQDVFDTPELLENILSCLPAREIYRVQAVSRLVHGLVAVSPQVRVKLGLMAGTGERVRMLSTISDEGRYSRSTGIAGALRLSDAKALGCGQVTLGHLTGDRASSQNRKAQSPGNCGAHATKSPNVSFLVQQTSPTREISEQ